MIIPVSEVVVVQAQPIGKVIVIWWFDIIIEGHDVHDFCHQEIEPSQKLRLHGVPCGTFIGVLIIDLLLTNFPPLRVNSHEVPTVTYRFGIVGRVRLL